MKLRWLLPMLLLPMLSLIAAAPIEAPSFERRLSNAAALLDGGDATGALAMLDPLLTVTEFPAERGQVETMRSFALARLNRIPEGRKAIEAGVASIPSPSLLVLRQLFLLRAFDGDPKAAAETLELIAASNPKGLGDIPTEVVGDVMRALDKDETRAFNLDYALVSAGWQPSDATLAETDWLRLRLITGLAKRDRLDEAPPILAAVLNPVVLVRLGIDRRFQKLWPVVEARLGPGADIADAAYVAAARARFESAEGSQAQGQSLKPPGGLIPRLGLAEALNIASREPEAMALADVAKSPAELAALSNREIWLVNLHAALLGDAGRIDEALARYTALNATSIEAHPALIGTIINHAVFAESVDRPRDAIAVADLAAAKGDQMNEYGRLFLAQARACSLAQLGDAVGAATAAAPLVAAADTNEDAYLAAMICLGRLDAAAAAVVRRLEGDDTRAEMLFQLQPFLLADRAAVREARQRTGMRTLKARADVKAAFLKYGRDLPAAVAPPR